MKQTNIIQRLCLFLFALMLAAPGWSKTDTWSATNRNAKEDEGTRQSDDKIVTVKWTNCKSSKALDKDKRHFEFRSGGTATITCKKGWRVRGISFSGGVEHGDRITCSSDGSLYTGNGSKGISCYDAPKQSITIKTSGDCEFVKYTIEYVQAPELLFIGDPIMVTTGERVFFADKGHLYNPSGLNRDYSITDTDIATCEATTDGFWITGKSGGTTTIIVNGHASGECAAATHRTKVYINRNNISPSLEWTSKTMKAWETPMMPNILGLPKDYPVKDITYQSSDESAVKVNNTNSTLIFGGSGYGKTATITITFPTTSTYNAKQLKYYVTVDNEMRIGSKADWQTFADQMEAGNTSINATMTADVDLQTDVIKVGNANHPFTGTFDGGGHTLSMNWDIKYYETAPFLFTSGGATIKNLHTKGQITTGTYGTSGLIDRVVGKTTISGCISEVDITSSYANGTCGASGLVFVNKGDLTITDCIVKGTFNGTTEKGSRGMSGFVFNQEAVCTISNSLYLGSNNGGDWSDTFAKDATITNCYYLNPCGRTQGTQVTTDQLKSGEVAHLLQGDRTDQFWGQMLGTEDEPQPTADAAKHVYNVDFTYNDKVVATRYANTGKGINGTLPTTQDILGDSYDAHHYYALAFADGFTASTAVTADKTIAVTLTDNEYFEIASADDWKAFYDLVNGGQNALNGKLTKNIDLGSNVWMIGNSRNHYSGTFDGDGHTLSLNWNISKDEAAPFLITSGGATIKNLHTKGQITTDANGTSGLIDRVEGKTTISKCISEVDITSSYANGTCGASGLVSVNAYQIGDLTITDCIVKGTFNGTTENARRGMGGFVYDQHAVCTISNSLYLGSNNGGDWSRTFAKNATITNCYYLNPCGTAQGTQVTEKQLKNGYVTKLLQADRTDACYWAQQLGEMPSLFNGNTWAVNRIYYDTVDQRWECNELNTSDYLSVGMDFYALRTRFYRNITANKPYTVTLPCEWSNSTDKVYVLSSVNKVKGMASFSQVENNVNGEFHSFEAYKPYLVVPTNNQSFIGGSNKRLVYAEPDTPVAEDVNGVQWCATYEGLTNAEAAAAGAYILQSDGLFHKVTTGNTAAVIPPYRAYITLSSDSQASGAKQLSISLGGETTGIRAIETTDKDGTVRYYDLQGRYIGNTLDGQPKGIYIKNGKKFINQ